MAAAKTTVAVFTGTSNTGGAALHYLTTEFAGQANVKAIVRTDQNVEALKESAPGVAIVKGDVLQPRMLQHSMKGCRAVYFAVPCLPNRAELGKKFIDACIENGVEYGIITSIIGANLKETEYQRQFAELEEYALSKAGALCRVDVGDKGKLQFKPIILRCALFYQNFYGSYIGMKSGTLYYPLGHGHEPGRLGHVDFHDVGRVVAKILIDPTPHGGKIYNLVGEYHFGNQVAAAVTMKAGVGCKYFDVDDATAIAAFEALGLQSWIAEGNVEMLRWFREGHGQDVPSDIPALLGCPPTKFGDFVKVHLKPLLTDE